MAERMEVDLKTECDSETLRDFAGQVFVGMRELVKVLRVPTPTSLTTEEVYEMVLEWLKEREIAEDYQRPNARGGNTPARNWTPEARRMRQVEVKEPDSLEDDCFWNLGRTSSPKPVNQVGRQTFRSSPKRGETNTRGTSPRKGSGDSGGGSAGAPCSSEVPKAASAETSAPASRPPDQGSSRPLPNREDWSTRGGNRQNLCWICGDPGHLQDRCPRRNSGEGRTGPLASGLSLYQNAQPGGEQGARAGYKGRGEKGMKGGRKGGAGFGGRGRGGVVGRY